MMTPDIAPGSIASLNADSSANPARRRVLLSLAAAAALPLAACGRDGQLKNVHGIDLTDAKWSADFSLKDPDGKTRSIADFKDKLVMLFFGFTQCPDVCPTTLARAAQVKAGLGADGSKLQVLFITVDPERDTPDVLRAYTTAFDPGFLGLYGDAKQTVDTAKAFKVFFQKVPTGSSYTMEHTALTYVFDTRGQLRLALRHEQTAAECLSDIRQLV
ncbi:SCO family protein [Pigmentiphaga aceris]